MGFQSSTRTGKVMEVGKERQMGPFIRLLSEMSREAFISYTQEYCLYEQTITLKRKVINHVCCYEKDNY